METDWKKITVTTYSGSEYTVIREGVDFYLLATHITTRISSDVNNGKWKVAQPKIPVVGDSWHIYSYYYEDYDNPLRMPGGGKFTSAVQTVHVFPED
jgi:hypothetical protein